MKKMQHARNWLALCYFYFHTHSTYGACRVCTQAVMFKQVSAELRKLIYQNSAKQQPSAGRVHTKTTTTTTPPVFPLHTARTLRGRASGAEWVAPVVCKQHAPHASNTCGAPRFSINNSHSSLCFFAPLPLVRHPTGRIATHSPLPRGQKALARTTRTKHSIYTHTHPVAPRWRPTATSRAAVSLCAAAAAAAICFTYIELGGPRIVARVSSTSTNTFSGCRARNARAPSQHQHNVHSAERRTPRFLARFSQFSRTALEFSRTHAVSSHLAMTRAQQPSPADTTYTKNVPSHTASASFVYIMQSSLKLGRIFFLVASHCVRELERDDYILYIYGCASRVSRWGNSWEAVCMCVCV